MADPKPENAQNLTGATADMPDPTKAQGFMEFGAAGLKQYAGYVREEWLPDLIGRKGLLKLREMRDNDPVIGAIFFAFEMMLRGVAFHVKPEDEKNPDDTKAADFIEACLGDTENSWAGMLAEILSFLQYGWCVHEIVYKMRKGDNPDPKFNSKYNDGLMGWRKFAIRGQETMLHWIFNPSGDTTHLVQLLPTGGPLLQVPLSKCLHFRTTPYKTNPEGRSVIRNCYVPYTYKKLIQEIEAIGCSRDLTGLVMVRVPSRWTLSDASESDKAAYANAKIMARDIARNQQEGIVYPTIRNADDKTQLDFEISLLSTGGRRQFATPEIIQRYDERMTMTVLADFITLGGGGSSGRGSFAQSKNKTDIFQTSAVAFLDSICAEFSRKAIPDLLKLNAMKGKCSLTHADIARRDITSLGQYILDLAGAGVLIPDEPLEEHLREEAGLPAADMDSQRLPPPPVKLGPDGKPLPSQPGTPGQKPAAPGARPTAQSGSDTLRTAKRRRLL